MDIWHMLMTFSVKNSCICSSRQLVTMVCDSLHHEPVTRRQYLLMRYKIVNSIYWKEIK